MGGGPFLSCFRLLLTKWCIMWVANCPCARSLALAELSSQGGGGGGGIPSLCSVISYLFVNYLSRLAPRLVFCLSLGELPGRGPFLLCVLLFPTDLSIISVETCPWAGSLALAR